MYKTQLFFSFMLFFSRHNKCSNKTAVKVIRVSILALCNENLLIPSFILHIMLKVCFKYIRVPNETH